MCLNIYILWEQVNKIRNPMLSKYGIYLKIFKQKVN